MNGTSSVETRYSKSLCPNINVGNRVLISQLFPKWKSVTIPKLKPGEDLMLSEYMVSSVKIELLTAKFELSWFIPSKKPKWTFLF